ncbi:hypothetical protein EMIHUDRAFT_466267 [Emiliania huxleyi CCMP1516]|uniref:SMP-30/Gluconolactonase/LRE-like region domain-containing protein n=2 Tax=Emiliania huxleyi TaxID=2903 RepID=A0A0D3HYF7_EMIH1|nr:hypothetical protein EMIHUDRAFT_466267 [Emiliania huxleyi CCMP1516]EOD04042.1 hypothetical protein EMIHUDRAFT_466267 [Emiliania huxleyi CCMP1516]|eukprot:XP_005756471.1 hypothetical protein EMIHUDRAFT_466267 [Emiliania huxleyi CCMP1516]
MAAAAAAALLLSAPLGMVVDPACAAPAVRLSRILPMMPAVSPEAAAERVVQFAADVGPSQLAWVPSSDVFTGDAEAVRSVERLAFLAGGSQWAWTEGGAPPQQLQPAAAAPVETHAVSAPAELAAVGGGEVWVRDLDAGGSAPVLSVAGADGAGGLLALSSGRFLLASGGGRLLLLEQDEGLEGLGGIGGRPPEWQALELLPDGALGGPLRSLCVSSTEDELFFAAGGAVLRAPLTAEARLAASPEPFVSTAPSDAAALATDAQRNLYVCVDEGVRVFDEQGEESLVISTPAPATGVCFGRFGGSSLSTLFVGAADSIWALPTQVQGAEASRSFRFLKQIEKQVQAQRHENW